MSSAQQLSLASSATLRKSSVAFRQVSQQSKPLNKNRLGSQKVLITYSFDDLRSALHSARRGLMPWPASGAEVISISIAFGNED